MARILVTDDEAGIREFLSDALELDGHSVDVASSGEDAITELKKRSYALLLTDLSMPGMSGMDLLRWVRREQPEVEVIVLTAHGTVDNAVEAMKLGAFEFLQKPISGPDELQLLVRRALERRQLKDQVALNARAQNHRAKTQPWGSGHGACGASAREGGQNQRHGALARRERDRQRGRGPGHPRIRAIAATSPSWRSTARPSPRRCSRANSSATRRAPSPAPTSARRGRIELADGGTFFLDEVGELKPELQAKLLRVLAGAPLRAGRRHADHRRRRALGGGDQSRPARDDRARGASARTSTTGSRSFPFACRRCASVRPISCPLPAVCSRRRPPSVGRPLLTLSPEAEKRLVRHDWPGNVRELANALERASILADSSEITGEDLWLDSGDTEARGPSGRGEVRHLVDLEKEAIAHALASVDGNRRKAADLLGIGERTLYDKIKRYEL